MNRGFFEGASRGRCAVGRSWLRCLASRSLLVVALLQVACATEASMLPRRLILALDGISFRHLQALQEGILVEDKDGQRGYRRAFHDGFFPVSRLVSTYPSTTDVAWTDIFGNRPLPGYQRTYYSRTANDMVYVNGVSSSMEFERQMTWRLQGGFAHAMSYLFPEQVFKCEVRDLVRDFLSGSHPGENYFGYLCTTDGAQHMWCDVFAMLCSLDEELQRLCASYRAREGRELEILILSDHGNNQAGPGKRVEIRSFLERAGYRLTHSISGPRDVVLPTVGIESWVEVHNAPAETERLLQQLADLEGVDLLSGTVPGAADRFVVMNSRRERGIIDWNRAENSFRYTPVRGDPLGYLPIADTLCRAGQLDKAGFAPAETWMQATFTHRYPMALERIARAHSTVTLNPATILLSLRNGYVHSGYMVKKGSQLLYCGGTHGGLDDLNSNGILLSNFVRTHDTSTGRVAALFGGFGGLRDYRAAEEGAEWINARELNLARIRRGPLECGSPLPNGGTFLRIWAPWLAKADSTTAVEVTIHRIAPFTPAKVRRPDDADLAAPKPLALTEPSAMAGVQPWERMFHLPAGARLAPRSEYRLEARALNARPSAPVLRFAFRTDQRGLPLTN